MARSLTIKLPDDSGQTPEELGRRQCRSAEDVAEDILERALAVARWRQNREQLQSRAEAAGFRCEDDILDATGDDHTLGKLSGADARQSKSTYVSLLGIDGARSALQTTLEQSRQSLGDANLLTASFDQLIHFVAHRDY